MEMLLLVLLIKSLTQIMLLWHQPQILPDVPPHINDAGHHQVLNLMLINMQSIISKKESLECINHHNPDIILGCETWLNESILNSEVFIYCISE